MVAASQLLRFLQHCVPVAGRPKFDRPAAVPARSQPGLLPSGEQKSFAAWLGFHLYLSLPAWTIACSAVWRKGLFPVSFHLPTHRHPALLLHRAAQVTEDTGKGFQLMYDTIALYSTLSDAEKPVSVAAVGRRLHRSVWGGTCTRACLCTGRPNPAVRCCIMPPHPSAPPPQVGSAEEMNTWVRLSSRAAGLDLTTYYEASCP